VVNVAMDQTEEGATTEPKVKGAATEIKEEEGALTIIPLFP